MLDDLAFDQRLDDVTHAGAFGEKVLTGFQLGACLQRNDPADEDDPVLVHHTFAIQQFGDVAYAGSRRSVADLVLLQRAWRFKTKLPEYNRAAATEQNQDQQREDRVAN